MCAGDGVTLHAMDADHHDEPLIAAVRDIMTERIPFNRMLGLQVLECEPERATLRLDMRPELIGHYGRGVVHGGVISSLLDVTGGLVALLGAMRRVESTRLEDKLACFDKLGTIDLRVDYLRPGNGDHYIAIGYLLRAGSRVAVTRMELHDDRDLLIAVGTGAYIVA